MALDYRNPVCPPDHLLHREQNLTPSHSKWRFTFTENTILKCPQLQLRAVVSMCRVCHARYRAVSSHVAKDGRAGVRP